MNTANDKKGSGAQNLEDSLSFLNSLPEVKKKPEPLKPKSDPIDEHLNFLSSLKRIDTQLSENRATQVAEEKRTVKPVAAAKKPPSKAKKKKTASKKSATEKKPSRKQKKKSAAQAQREEKNRLERERAEAKKAEILKRQQELQAKLDAERTPLKKAFSIVRPKIAKIKTKTKKSTNVE